MQPLILGMNFWHRLFLINNNHVDHYPLIEFPCDSGSLILDSALCSKIMQKSVHQIMIYNVFMLCSFGTSTEASAPAVLSFLYSLRAGRPQTQTEKT